MYRCSWSLKTSIETEYHDTEWGVPIYDDNSLFELLLLELSQSGLSWSTILAKREGYREAFDNFDIVKIANYGDEKINSLYTDTRIVRHKVKINSTINNAQKAMEVQKEFGSLSCTFGPL